MCGLSCGLMGDSGGQGGGYLVNARKMTNFPYPRWCRIRHGGLIRYSCNDLQRIFSVWRGKSHIFNTQI